MKLKSKVLLFLVVLALAGVAAFIWSVTAGAAPEPEPALFGDWEGAKQKWVPILDVSNNGVHVGAAQIAGPEVQVDKCKAVALLGLKFKNTARIKVYVPIPNYNVLKLERVQGVSVWATGDVKIVNF